MIPSIPSRVPQLLVLFGISLIVYTIISYEKLSDRLFDLEVKHDPYSYSSTDRRIDSLMSDTYFTLLESRIYADSLTLSKKIDKKSPEFINELRLSKAKHIMDLKPFLFTSDSAMNKRIRSNEIILRVIKTLDSNRALHLFLMFTGLLLILSGTILWIKNENLEEVYKRQQLIDKPIASKCCQSCGINFCSTTKYGTEIDKSKNFSFCLDCFQNGKYVEPDITLDIVHKRSCAEVKELGFSCLHRYIYSQLFFIKLNSLDRWNKNNRISNFSINLGYMCIVLVITLLVFFLYNIFRFLYEIIIVHSHLSCFLSQGIFHNRT